MILQDTVSLDWKVWFDLNSAIDSHLTLNNVAN